MSYYLGVDVGTTYTAAAVWRAGRVEVASLGNRAPVVPSVVLRPEHGDGEMLVGEAAVRRAATQPHLVAREFKRRIGDPTPIILGGAPYSAEALTARVLRWVVDTVSEAQGGRPAGVAVSHPANWGDYKLDRLRQAVQLADLDGTATVSEPEAAAIHYATQGRVEPGSVIAVYDLGGGTFDAAVLHKSPAGWEILGDPQGIEHLGGVDFDEAVFRHVTAALGDALAEVDPDDPAVVTAVHRLRQECVEAKEALSADTHVTIPVLLPGVSTEVRLTRVELENMVRPALADSIGAMDRALRSAGVESSDVSSVLLVGGSSRLPIVAQLVGSEMGRPVAVDAHPKFGIALGAAIVAAEQDVADAAATSEVDAVDEGVSPAAAAGAAAAGAAAGAAAAQLLGRDGDPRSAAPIASMSGHPTAPAPPTSQPPTAPVWSAHDAPTEPLAPTEPWTPTEPLTPTGPFVGAPAPTEIQPASRFVPPGEEEPRQRSRRPLWLALGGIAAAAVIGIVAAVALTDGDGGGGTTPTDETTTTAGQTTTTAAETTTTTAGQTTTTTAGQTTTTAPQTIQVPNVVGSNEGSARAQLSAFTVQVAEQQTPNATEDDIVLSQTPSGGEAAPGSTVTIVVGRFVPDPEPPGTD